MFDFLNMALMGIQDPMALATQMASQNIAPQMMDEAIGGMIQPSMGDRAGGTIPMPDMSMGISGTPGPAAMAQQSGPGVQVAALDHGIFDGFMNTVRSKVTNPNGLAAIAATGMRESGFSAGNAFREWNDGANNAGGIMSWNGSRLSSLKRFGGAEDMKALSPEIQGQFFLQENPDLIAKLNAAESPSAAQALMNNAWQFKGFDNPDHPETKARFATVEKVAPLFQGGDPSLQTPGTGDASVMESIGGIQKEKANQATQMAAIDAEFGGGAGGAALAMNADGTTATKPQTLAEKMAAIGKGLKVPEGGSNEKEPPRITGGLAPNVGGGFGRDPQSMEKLFAMLGGTAPSASPVPSLAQLIKGVTS